MAKALGLVLVALSLALSIAQAASLSGEQVADIAKSICKHPRSGVEELKSVSSMLQVIGYFESELADEACRDRWLSSMQYLKVVLTVGNSNACGDEKLSALEEFNRRYISTTSEDKHAQKKEEHKAPKAIRVFFLHYANLVSSICKDNLAASIQDSGLATGNLYGKPIDLGELDELSGKLMSGLALDMVKNGYMDVILPWKMIDQHHFSSLEKRFLSKKMDVDTPATRLPVRLSLRVNNVSKLQSIHKTCLENLKPAYSRFVLPAMRLINLGLYEEGDQLASLLASDETTQRLFKVALFCETMLPVEAFEDKSLPIGKVIAITPKRAAALREAQPTLQSSGSDHEESDQSAPAGPSVEGVDEIESLADYSSGKRLTKNLKANRVKQEGLIKRFLKMSKAMVKDKIKTKIGQLYSLVNPVDNSAIEFEVEEDSTEIVRKKRMEPNLIGMIVIGAVCGLVILIFIGIIVASLISNVAMKFA